MAQKPPRATKKGQPDLAAMARSPGAVCFCEVTQGFKGRVVHVPEDGPSARRLREMGLVEGTVIEVLKVAPLGDPIEILVRGYRLCLRKGECSGVILEVLES